jgi:Flp pilus assembly protein TadG
MQGLGQQRRLARDERGAAALEFALLTPVLVLLVGGVVDCSRLIAQTLQVAAAAQAGADYAQRRGWDLQGVTTAVSAATPIAAAASPAPTLLTACVSGGDIVSTTAAACSGGDAPGRFVTVSARAPFSPLFPGVGELVLPQTVSAQATVRIP